MEKLLNSTASPFTDDDYEPSEYANSFLSRCNVLVVGAGGLGCEILKNLVLSKFRAIQVIDMDTIELSNLNRQFLFKEKDIGKSKAFVAAQAVNSTLGSCITPHFCRIEDKDESFYAQFDLIICGLDSIAARRWLNAKVCSLVKFDKGEIDASSVIPIIDGGTEGLKGNSRVIIPFVTACFECTLDLFPPATSYPLCTIANTPRLPEHCIEWAAVVEWPRVYENISLDADDPEHIDWILRVSNERAAIFKIPIISRRLAIGVLKNVIPAIASTNAIIAANCCIEALKMVTKLSPFLNNYFLFNGSDSVYTFAYTNERKVDCPICSKTRIVFKCSKDSRLQDLYDFLQNDCNPKLMKPSLRTTLKSLYIPIPEALEIATRMNLDKPLFELVDENSVIFAIDSSIPFPIEIQLSTLENKPFN